ncbi:hypothetical protein BC831DRAFT_278806 [Entophlyctis helioformis]|nr:hypothetical protein BC831DRAFT_278806 [Entophlyctis helioformis]
MCTSTPLHSWLAGACCWWTDLVTDNGCSPVAAITAAVEPPPPGWQASSQAPEMEPPAGMPKAGDQVSMPHSALNTAAECGTGSPGCEVGTPLPPPRRSAAKASRAAFKPGRDEIKSMERGWMPFGNARSLDGPNTPRKAPKPTAAPPPPPRKTSRPRIQPTCEDLKSMERGWKPAGNARSLGGLSATRNTKHVSMSQPTAKTATR